MLSISIKFLFAILGYSKSVGYEPGYSFKEKKFTNTWNAVLIDGSWRFIQCQV